MTHALSAEGIRVQFGGLVAVDRVTMHADRGRITGLIGPNGAGKTTTFNALTGLVKAEGTVQLAGERLDRMTPRRRALAGLGRTFQRMELFDAMSVFENVRMGPETLDAGRSLARHLRASRRERSRCGIQAMAAIERCGLADLASRRVGELSTGQRRLVELARAISSQFSVLLLDEPASGLDPNETERVGEVLLDLVRSEDIGVVLVEHDMALVRMTCEYLYVLNFGRLLAEGDAAEVLASEEVRSAYLGSSLTGAES